MTNDYNCPDFLLPRGVSQRALEGCFDILARMCHNRKHLLAETNPVAFVESETMWL